MSLNRRTIPFHLAVCCLLWSSWSLLLADGGDGELDPTSLPAYSPWQLLKVSARFGEFSPYPTFIEGQSPRRAAQPDNSQQCTQAGMCITPAAATTESGTNAGLQVPGAAAAGTATADSATDLQAQQARQQKLQTAAEQQQQQQEQQQQHVESQLQHPQEPQQPPALQEGGQALPQAPEQQPPTPAGEAALQQPAAADIAPQQVLVLPTRLTPTPTPASSTAAETDAAVPVPASQEQLQRAPQAPVRRLLNLAQLSDGASVLAANPEAKKPERAIDKDIDSFMKNECNAHKWMIIELSQLGTVETVRLTMKELYSSRVHTFRVFGRSTHPRKDGPDLAAGLASDAWQLLGSFTAENKRGTQAFSLPQRSRVRYLLLSFDTHYGSEEICAMNWIEVLGVSAAQELEEALALQELEAEGEEHEQQQQLQQLTLQQQQQQLVIEPVPLQLQQQTQSVGEQHAQQEQAAVPAAVTVHELPGVAGTGSAQTPAGGSNGGGTAVNSQQQSMGVDAAGQSAEQQQQDAAPQAAAQQPGQQQAATLEGGSSLQAQQDVPASTADEAVVTGLAASSGQLADQTATSAGQASAAASGVTTAAAAAAAAAAHQPTQGTSPSAVAGDKGGRGEAVEVQGQQQQQQQQTAATAAAELGDAAVTKNGKLQQPRQPSLVDDSQSVSPAVAAQVGTVPPADASAESSSGSAPAVGTTSRQHLPAPAAAAGVPGAEGGGYASTPAAGSSTGTPAAAAEQLQSSTLAAARSDAAVAAAAGVAGGAAPADKPTATVSADGADAATGAAAQPATAVSPAHVATPSSDGDSAASALQTQQPAQSQQQVVTPPQQQQQQPAATQQRPHQKAHLREGASVLDTWSSTAKPKQAGNLFDIIKSEMMQMKLDQSKVSKKLDGLAKRSTEYEAAVVLLQQQQAQVLAQINDMATRLVKIAEQQEQQQQAATARQYVSHPHMPRPAGSAVPGEAGALHHPHVYHPYMQSSRPIHGRGTSAEPHIPVCESHLHQRELLLQPRYQWGIAAGLSLTCALGLCLLLHPRGALLPQWLRVAVCCLAVLNGVLAGLMSMWLVVLQSILVGPAVVPVPAGPLQSSTHRMLGSSAWEQLKST